MEEETGRKKQAEAWGAALLVSAQNMVIPAHSSSVPVSAVGAAAAQQSLILLSVQHDSEAKVGEKRLAPDSAQELPGPSVGVLPLHMIEEETAGPVRTATMQRRLPAVHRVVDSSSVQNSTE